MGKTKYQQTIIAKLRRLREEKGYSQQKIGYILGLSNGQVGNIESTKQTHKYTLIIRKTKCYAFEKRNAHF